MIASFTFSSTATGLQTSDSLCSATGTGETSASAGEQEECQKIPCRAWRYKPKGRKNEDYSAYNVDKFCRVRRQPIFFADACSQFLIVKERDSSLCSEYSGRVPCKVYESRVVRTRQMLAVGIEELHTTRHGEWSQVGYRHQSVSHPVNRGRSPTLVRRTGSCPQLRRGVTKREIIPAEVHLSVAVASALCQAASRRTLSTSSVQVLLFSALCRLLL